jgi:hypothetical protein
MAKKFVFVFWLVAVFFNIINIWMVIVFKEAFYTDHMVITDIVPDTAFIGMDILFSIVFSLPGVFMLYILLWVAREFVYTEKAAWSLISTGSSVIVILCYLIMEFVMSLGMSVTEYLPFITGSLVAVWISLLFMRRRFNVLASRIYEANSF